MNYKEIKNTQIASLPFVKHVIINDGSVKTIEMEFEGKQYLISCSWENIKISEPKPDEFKDVFQLTGEINGAEIKPKIFETEREADAFLSTLGDNTLVKDKVQFNVTKNELPAHEDTIPF